MRLHYFNISIDNINLDQALARVQQFLSDGQQHYIVTPNPEFIMQAKYDTEFRSILRQADLSLIDGFGLSLALRLLSGEKISRLTGADFVLALLTTLNHQRSFFFLGGEQGASHRAALVARSLYDTNVVGTFEPKRGTYDAQGPITVLNPVEHEHILTAINQAKPELLIVALGHNVQEKWMAKYLRDCPTVKIAMGVGGALNYLSGDVTRAPRALRKLGLEWLWRLGQQPWRWRRIIRAVVGFPLETLYQFWANHILYRDSVVGCILNSVGHILLVTRQEDHGHWFLPQGGCEPQETAAQAILREMHEELGTDKLRIIGQSRPNVHRYSWKHQWRQRSIHGDTNVPQYRYGYRGQQQTVFYLRFIGTDSDIHLDQKELGQWKWVSPNHLLSALHPVRRKLGAIILKDIHDLTS